MSELELKILSNSQRKISILLENSELENKVFGQLYLVEIMPGMTVGNHYHEHRDEVLIPIKGEKIRIALEDTKTKHKDELVIDVESYNKKLVIQRYVAHSITNKSDKPLLLIEYSTRPFDPKNDDKIAYKVRA